MSNINGEFCKYSTKNDLFLAYPTAKAPRCREGAFRAFTNADWRSHIQETDNLGLKRAKFGRVDNQLSCFEADSAEQDDALEAFIHRHNIDALVFRGDNGGYKHYLVRHDARLINVRRYCGFEVKHDWILIPPSKTTSGKRKWRESDEERFIAGDVPPLPNSAVEEILRSEKAVLKTFRNGLPIISRDEWDTRFLAGLHYTESAPGEWIRPCSHTGARSLAINMPEKGLVSVYSTGIDKLRQGVYPFQLVYARLKGTSLQQAYKDLGLGEQDCGTIIKVEYVFDDRYEFIVKDIVGLNKDGTTTAVAFVVYSDTTKIPAYLLGTLAVAFAITAVALVSRGKQSVTWRNDPATAKQKSFADDLGIRYPRNITKGDLSALIDEALENER
jgi:hypothetical protein